MSNSAAGSFGTKRQAERNYGAPPFSQRAIKQGWGILIVTENDCARKGGPLRANTQKPERAAPASWFWLAAFTSAQRSLLRGRPRYLWRAGAPSSNPFRAWKWGRSSLP